MQQWGGLKEHTQRTALARAVAAEEGLPQQGMQSAKPSKEVGAQWVGQVTDLQPPTAALHS